MDTEDHSLAEATQELAPPPEAAVPVPLARTKNVFRLGYGGYLHYAPTSLSLPAARMSLLQLLLQPPSTLPKKIMVGKRKSPPTST